MRRNDEEKFRLPEYPAGHAVKTMTRGDYSAMTDEQLVRASQGGDMLAFEELVTRHRDKMYGRAFSMLRKEEAALDATQEAWVKAWRRLEQFQGDSSFTTWLTRIVINLCLDKLRADKRTRAESIQQLEEEKGGVERQLPLVNPNPTEGLEREELRARIDEAMAQLSHEHRSALILYEYEDLEYKEIAERMGCSIGTVMSRLFYARRRMAALMANWKKEQ